MPPKNPSNSFHGAPTPVIPGVWGELIPASMGKLLVLAETGRSADGGPDKGLDRGRPPGVRLGGFGRRG